MENQEDIESSREEIEDIKARLRKKLEDLLSHPAAPQTFREDLLTALKHLEEK